MVVPTTTGIKLRESLKTGDTDPAATAQQAAASQVPLVRENDAGEMVFTGKMRTLFLILSTPMCVLNMCSQFMSMLLLIPLYF